MKKSAGRKKLTANPPRTDSRAASSSSFSTVPSSSTQSSSSLRSDVQSYSQSSSAIPSTSSLDSLSPIPSSSLSAIAPSSFEIEPLVPLVPISSQSPPLESGSPRTYHELQPLLADTDDPDRLSIVNPSEASSVDSTLTLHQPDDASQPASPKTLYDCIRGVTLDVKAAAQIIMEARRSGSFNKTVYEEFIISEAAYRVKNFEHDFFIDADDKLGGIAHFLITEILVAKYDRVVRSIEAQPRQQPVTVEARSMAINNLTRNWIIDESPPFKRVEIPQLLTTYTFNPGETTCQHFSALFRFLFQKLTDPPEKIQEYSIRYFRKAGREKALRNLPDHVEMALIDFALDLIGLGEPELRLGRAAARDISRFYMSLGESEADRKQKLNELLADYASYKHEIQKGGLQAALRDIRSYEYDTQQRQWYSLKEEDRICKKSDHRA